MAQLVMIATEFEETPVGVIDGTNCVFTTTHPALKLNLYKNGDLQDTSSRSISGKNIILTTAPIPGDTLNAQYLY